MYRLEWIPTRSAEGSDAAGGVFFRNVLVIIGLFVAMGLAIYYTWSISPIFNPQAGPLLRMPEGYSNTPGVVVPTPAVIRPPLP